MIDESLLKSILQTLPPCLIFHLIASIYAYGVPGVLVDEQDPRVLEYIDNAKGADTSYIYKYSVVDDLIRRAKKSPHLVGLLAVILLYYLVDMVLLRLFYLCFKKQN